MNKIVPIITLCLAVAVILLNAVALMCAIISFWAAPLKLIAIPAAIVGLVIVTIQTPLAFLFKKDILCKISFFIDLVSLLIAISAVAVGFSAM